MAIAVKLDDLLHDRRMTLTELADRVGMTLANLSILKTGKARAIRFSTLDAICEALVVPARRPAPLRAGAGRTRATIQDGDRQVKRPPSSECAGESRRRRLTRSPPAG